MKLKNVLIVVKDIEKSKQFYHDLFGLDMILDNDGNMIEVFVNNGEYVITNAVYDLSDELSGNAELFGLACAEE